MRCSDFLKRYSDFRDGAVADPTMGRRLVLHVSRCRSCARYHRALGQGIDALRETSAVEPSDRFRVELRCRLAQDVRRRRQRAARRTRIAASLVVTGVVTALVSASITHSADQIETPAPVPEQPMPMVTAYPGYPFVTFIDMSPAPFEGTRPVPAPLFDDSTESPSGATPGYYTVPAQLPY